MIAVSLGHRCGDEFLTSFTAQVHAMSGAPIRKRARIDANPHDRMSIGLEPLLHLHGHLAPLRKAAWQPVAIGKKLQQRRVIFLVDPIDPDRRKRLVR